jgi:hypothetical protein
MLEAMTITIAGIPFDHHHYDERGDVLYLNVGEPRSAARQPTSSRTARRGCRAGGCRWATRSSARRVAHAGQGRRKTECVPMRRQIRVYAPGTDLPQQHRGAINGAVWQTVDQLV